MDENEIIELTGENGDTIKAEYLDTVLVDDKEYVVLLPIDETTVMTAMSVYPRSSS